MINNKRYRNLLTRGLYFFVSVNVGIQETVSLIQYIQGNRARQINNFR